MKASFICTDIAHGLNHAIITMKEDSGDFKAGNPNGGFDIKAPKGQTYFTQGKKYNVEITDPELAPVKADPEPGEDATTFEIPDQVINTAIVEEETNTQAPAAEPIQ